ncbi:MAG: hypothetical protein ACI9KN_002057 [Gammaproteobacteria bacterium]
MKIDKNPESTLSGGCLCGQLRYQISGPRRSVINCHCENCRRTHGHIAAYTSVDKKDLVLQKQESLIWFHDQSPNAYRGFCGSCGSSLFWDAADRNNKMAVAAGTLDSGHGLKTIGHIYVSEMGEYYQIEDSLPQFQTSSDGELDGL